MINRFAVTFFIVLAISGCSRESVYEPYYGSGLRELIQWNVALNKVVLANREREIEQLQEALSEAQQIANEAVAVATEANRQADHLLKLLEREVFRQPPQQVADMSSLRGSLDRRVIAQAGLEDLARAIVALSNFRDVSACGVIPEDIGSVAHFQEFAADLRISYHEACLRAFKAYEVHRLALR